MVRKKYNKLKQILLLASLLTVFFSLSVNAQSLPLLPDGLPQGYETWAVVYDFPNRTITMEQKLNADFWKQNLTEPIPPIWWFNEVLGRSYPESSPYDQQIADAQDRGDWATELELKQRNIDELGITTDEQSMVTSRWFDRNPYHNLSYFALGVTDKKTRTFMSNQNPDDPFSPFAKEGENIMVVEVLEDNVSGIMELTDLDITRIGLFEKGFTLFGGEDYIRGLVEKAQKAKFFLGVSRRENGWESYAGFKVGGIFGIAFRKIDPVSGACGSANGGTFSTLSSTSANLCNPGTVINFSGSGPWTWICQGSNGGSNSPTCSANKQNTGTDYPLIVNSTNPASGVSINVSPNDNGGQGNGTTQFTRTYRYGTSVMLTAPSTAGGNNLSSWSGCGAATGTTCYVTMNSERTVTAMFVTPPSSCTASVSSDRWKGEYFNNTTFSGSPSMTRDDGTALNFNWYGSAVSGTCNIGADNFSVRWTREVAFNAGTYRFSMTVDDGGRLYVNGTLYIDKWFDQWPATYTVDVPLTAGTHHIVMEYYQRSGGTTAALSWQPIH